MSNFNAHLKEQLNDPEFKFEEKVLSFTLQRTLLNGNTPLWA